MQRTLLARVVAGAMGIAGTAHAQDDAVMVTGTPLGSGLFELVSPASVLDGRQLLWERKSTLGETLERLPGVSSSYFGPQVSRPVIRGLDGDRIRVLQNGTGTLDASSLSFDHAVPYDPLAAERIEIVRGPAAVLYGGNAVGGVVNSIDNRIPETPLHGVTGRIEPRYGGADRERSIGGVVEGGNGAFALHAGGFSRKTDDVRTPVGTLANSNARSDGGTLGGSLTWDKGYLGLSQGEYRSNYGSIPEPEVRIDMKSRRTDVAGEVRELGSAVKALKFKVGRTDYQHQELETGTVNTTFKNEGSDGRFELVHGKLGPLQGALGVTFTDFDFSALGAEAFVPSTSTRAQGLFLYEELPVGSWKFSVGARNERTEVKSEGGAQFGPAQQRDISANSGAAGAVYSFSKSLALAANLSSTQRAPTFYELYANGPHAATGTFEVGNSAFEKEKSRSVDVGLRWRSEKHSASVGVFRTRFDNFITLFNSGNTRGVDGELNPVDADEDGVADGSGEDILPEFTYQAVPAEFRGLELQGRWRVYERTGALDLLLKGDYVKAFDRSTGQPLPRIAPLRFGAGLQYSLNGLAAALDVQYAAAQNRVSANEPPTDSYTLVNATLSYSWKLETAALQVFLRLDNLFDEEARNHVSFIKDIAPLPGRGVLVGLRGTF